MRYGAYKVKVYLVDDSGKAERVYGALPFKPLRSDRPWRARQINHAAFYKALKKLDKRTGRDHI